MNLETLILEFGADFTALNESLENASRKARSTGASIEKVFGGLKLNIVPKVDHKPLVALNDHLTVKEKHIDKLNKKVIIPRTDLKNLQALDQKISDTADKITELQKTARIAPVANLNGLKAIDVALDSNANNFRRVRREFAGGIDTEIRVNTSNAENDINQLKTAIADLPRNVAVMATVTAHYKSIHSVEEARKPSRLSSEIKSSESGGENKKLESVFKTESERQVKQLEKIHGKIPRDGLLGTLLRSFVFGFGQNVTEKFSRGFLTTFEKKSKIDTENVGSGAGVIAGIGARLPIETAKYGVESGKRLAKSLGIDNLADDIENIITDSLVDAIDNSVTLSGLLANASVSLSKNFVRIQPEIEKALASAKKIDTYLEAFQVKPAKDGSILQLEPIRRVGRAIAPSVDQAVRQRRERTLSEKGVPAVLNRVSEILEANAGKEGEVTTDKIDKLVKGKKSSRLGVLLGTDAPRVITPETKELVITIGGYAGHKQAASGLRTAGSVIDQAYRDGRKDIAAIGLRNPDTDLKPEAMGSAASKMQGLLGSLTKPILRGFSKDAVEMAAQAIAAMTINPTIKIKFVGESGGGYAAEEATQLLNLLGLGHGVEGAGFGTPNFVGGINPENYQKFIGKDQLETLGYETHQVYAPAGFADVSNPNQNLIGLTGHPIEHYEPLDVFQQFVFGKSGASSKPQKVNADAIKNARKALDDLLNAPELAVADIKKAVAEMKDSMSNVDVDAEIENDFKKLQQELNSLLESEFLETLLQYRSLLGKAEEIADSSMAAGTEEGKQQLKSLLADLGKVQGNAVKGFADPNKRIQSMSRQTFTDFARIRQNIGDINVDPRLLQYRYIGQTIGGHITGASGDKDRLNAIKGEINQYKSAIESDPTLKNIPEVKQIGETLNDAIGNIDSELESIFAATPVGKLAKASETAIETLGDAITGGLANVAHAVIEKLDEIATNRINDIFLQPSQGTIDLGAKQIGSITELTGRDYLQLAGIGTRQTLAGVNNGIGAIMPAVRGGYGVLKGAENLAFGALPFARETKGVLQNTVLPAAVFGAATHFLPGGGAMAGELSSLAHGMIDTEAFMQGGALATNAGNFLANHGLGGIAQPVSQWIGGNFGTIATNAVDPLISIFGGKAAMGMAGGAAQSLLTPSNKQEFKALPQSTAKIQQQTELVLRKVGENAAYVRERVKQIDLSFKGASDRLKLPSAKEIKALPPEKLQEEVSKAISHRESILRSGAHAIQEIDKLLADIAPEERMRSPLAGLKGRIQSAINKAERFRPTQKLKKMGVDASVVDAIEVRAVKVDLSSEGANVVDGFVDGIRKNLQELKIVSEEMADIPTDITKKVLDIQSPSGEFEEIGRNIIEGEIKGIESEVPDLKSAITAIHEMIAESSRIALGSPINENFNISEMLKQSTDQMESVAKSTRTDHGGNDSIKTMMAKSMEVVEQKAIKEMIDRSTKRMEYLASTANDGANKPPIPPVDNNRHTPPEQPIENGGNIPKADVTMLERVNNLIEETGNNAQKANTALDSIGDTSPIEMLQSKLKEVHPLIGKVFDFGSQLLSGVIGIQLISSLQNALSQLAPEAFNAALGMERLRTSLNFSTGDANGALSRLKQQADELGTSFLSSAKNYQQFGAAVMNTPLEFQRDKIFEGINVGLATRGADSQQQDRALLAITQIASKGRVSMEELNQQLGEALPGALQVAARSMGLTSQEFIKLIESGGVLAEDLLPKLATQIKLESAGGINAIDDTAFVQIARYQNQLELLKIALGEPLLDATKLGLPPVTAALKLLTDNGEKVATALLSIGLVSIGGFVMILKNIGAIDLALKALGITANTTSGAMSKVGLGLLKGFGWTALIYAGVAAITELYRVINAGSEEAKKSLKSTKDALNELAEIQGRTPVTTENKNPIQKAFDFITFGNREWQRISTVDKIQEGSGLTNQFLNETTNSFKPESIAKFQQQLEPLRKQLKDLKVDEIIASGQADAKKVTAIRKEIARTNEEIQKLTEKSFPEIGLIIGQIATAEERIKELRKILADPESGTLERSRASNEMGIIESQLRTLKKRQEEYNEAVKENLTDYQRLSSQINQTARTLSNIEFTANTQNILSEIETKRAVLAGRVKPFEMDIMVRENSLAVAKSQLNSLQIELGKKENELQKTLTDDINERITALMPELKGLDFRTALRQGNISSESIDQRLQQLGDQVPFELKQVLETAKQQASIRQQTLNIDKSIVDIELELRNSVLQRVRNMRAANITGEDVNRRIATISRLPFGGVFAAREDALSELSKQEKLLAEAYRKQHEGTEDPGTIKQEIDNTRLAVAQARANLLQQQSAVSEYYRNLGRQVADFKRQLEDYNRRIEDTRIAAAKEARSLSESYADLNKELTKSLNDAKNRLSDTRDQIAIAELRNELNKGLTPGGNSLARQFNDTILDILTKQTESASKGRSFKSRAEEIEANYIASLRRIRDIQEQQQEAERNRLRTIQDIKRTQQDLNRTLSDLIRQTNKELGYIPNSIKSIVNNLNALPRPIGTIQNKFTSLAPAIEKSGQKLVSAIEKVAKTLSAKANLVRIQSRPQLSSGIGSLPVPRRIPTTSNVLPLPPQPKPVTPSTAQPRTKRELAALRVPPPQPARRIAQSTTTRKPRQQSANKKRIAPRRLAQQNQARSMRELTSLRQPPAQRRNTAMPKPSKPVRSATPPRQQPLSLPSPRPTTPRQQPKRQTQPQKAPRTTNVKPVPSLADYGNQLARIGQQIERQARNLSQLNATAEKPRLPGRNDLSIGMFAPKTKLPEGWVSRTTALIAVEGQQANRLNERGRQANQVLRSSPEIQAFIDLIALAKGTLTAPYNNRINPFTKEPLPGRYEMGDATFASESRSIGLDPNIDSSIASPGQQNLALISRLGRFGVIDEIMKGDIKKAIEILRRELFANAPDAEVELLLRDYQKLLRQRKIDRGELRSMTDDGMLYASAVVSDMGMFEKPTEIKPTSNQKEIINQPIPSPSQRLKSLVEDTESQPLQFAPLNLTPLPKSDFSIPRGTAEAVKNTEQKILDSEKFLQSLQEEMDRFTGQDKLAEFAINARNATRDLVRSLRDSSESVIDLTQNSKGYLTVAEEVASAGRDVVRQYRSQIEALQDRRAELDRQKENNQNMIDAQKTAVLQLTDSEQIKLAQDGIKALEENSKATANAIAEIDRNLSTLGRNQGAAEATAKMIKLREATLQANEKYLSLMADLADRREFTDPMAAVFGGGGSELRIKSDYMRRADEMERFIEKNKNLLSSSQIEEMRNGLTEMANTDLSKAFVDANPALSGFRDILKGAVMDFNNLGQTAINVLQNIASKLLDNGLNMLLSSIFGGNNFNPFNNRSSGGGNVMTSIMQAGIAGIAGFADGGTVGNPLSGFKIPIFADGGTVGKAMQMERQRSGKEPFIVVAHKDEEILSTLNYDAQFFRTLKRSGQWDELKSYYSVPTFAIGGTVVGSGSVTSTANKRQRAVYNQTTVYNVTTPNADSFRKADKQIIEDRERRNRDAMEKYR